MPMAQYVYEVATADGVRPVPAPGDLLVVATQDCDLVKPMERDPYVEFLAARVVDDVRTIKRNDGRYFVLNPEELLIADRLHQVRIYKDALLEVAPPDRAPCGGDLPRAREFAVWLGARYDRVALPDAFVDLFQRPLVKAFEKLCGPGKKLAALNRDMQELRVAGEVDSEGPYRIGVVCLINDDADPVACSAALAEVLARAGLHVEDTASEKERAAAPLLVAHIEIVTPGELSIRDYFGTLPVPLEDISFAGHVRVGAIPIDREGPLATANVMRPTSAGGDSEPTQ